MNGLPPDLMRFGLSLEFFISVPIMLYGQHRVRGGVTSVLVAYTVQ